MPISRKIQERIAGSDLSDAMKELAVKILQIEEQHNPQYTNDYMAAIDLFLKRQKKVGE